MPARRGGRGGPGGRPQIRQHRPPGPHREQNEAAGSNDQCMSGAEPAGDGTVSRVLVICNKKGLHARASAKFVQTVERFDAEVCVKRNGDTVGGTSIMGLMMLAAA